jgi:hypothetical protein
MPAPSGQIRTAEYRAAIYLRGSQDTHFYDADPRFPAHADRFGWHVLETVHESATSADPGQLLAKVTRAGADILLTDTPDMISPDRHRRHDLITAIEAAGCIVHPITTPGRSVNGAVRPSAAMADPVDEHWRLVRD